MAINFNSLPKEKPATSFVIPKGQYVGTIKKAEMKQPKDTSKPEYLSVEMECTDPDTQAAVGKLWIILTESEAALARFQLSRFITALELPITGEFELKDLTKIIVNKSLLVDVIPEENKDGKPAQRSILDINAGNIFYPIGQSPAPATMAYTPVAHTPVAEMETPFTVDAVAPAAPIVHSQY